MEIFHYLAEKLKIVANFENDNKTLDVDKGFGAVYNDFDFNSQALLDGDNENITFSQSSNLNIRFDEQDEILTKMHRSCIFRDK